MLRLFLMKESSRELNANGAKNVYAYTHTHTYKRK